MVQKQFPLSPGSSGILPARAAERADTAHGGTMPAGQRLASRCKRKQLFFDEHFANGHTFNFHDHHVCSRR